MPTNQPFFANFLAAFRAHSSPAYKAASSSTSPTTLASSAHVSTTSSTATSTTTTPHTRSIATKAGTSPTTQPSNNSPQSPPANTNNTFSTAAAVVAASSHIHHVSPLSRSPGVSTPHNMSMSPPGGGTSTPLSRGRQRRGSDSSNSSGGFIDALGPEKWYIGGRTATGEEKFYRLGLVTGGPGRRVRSLDRLSL
ncbi:hypothetical protein GJ744_008225 [Endocarpon pusillum]|uniref:Uncharacterized protein n=1 Tax=Endocarpon pusillum TaxID=364733 RepID=A0A8H7AQ64_9EURO|nr:hypothetical protein GJ744_008225 [Endocarpon pusillum]